MSKYNKIRITGLPTHITEDDLRHAFDEYGDINVVYISPNLLNERKVAFIVFSTDEQAKAAIHGLNYGTIDGELIKISYGDEETLSIIQSGKNRVIIEGLTPDVDEKTLYQTFSQFHEIIYIALPTTPTGKLINIAIIAYRTFEECKDIVEQLNGVHMGDSVITVKLCPQLKK